MKTAPGLIYGWNFWNLDSTVNYVQFYDALIANVTVGSSSPVFSLAIPPSGGLDDWLPASSHGDGGLFVFQTGVVIACTTTPGGSTDPSNGVVVNLGYV